MVRITEWSSGVPSDDLARVRAECEAQLRKIRIPHPFSIEAFCEILSEDRGRPILLLPLPEPLDEDCLFGVWAATDTEDYILYQQDTTELHRSAILLHEISHMILGHNADVVLTPEAISQILPDLTPDLVQSMAFRHAYDSVEEQQAEVLGSLILDRSLLELPLAVDSDSLVRGLADTLRHPRQRRRRG